LGGAIGDKEMAPPLTFEQYMLLEKTSLMLLLSSVFLRHHDRRDLVFAEKWALLVLVASIAARNYFAIKPLDPAA
jgi:hypothetical protein